jgi:hypothetical protein
LVLELPTAQIRSQSWTALRDLAVVIASFMKGLYSPINRSFIS